MIVVRLIGTEASACGRAAATARNISDISNSANGIRRRHLDRFGSASRIRERLA